jgi:hypothetical protein
MNISNLNHSKPDVQNSGIPRLTPKTLARTDADSHWGVDLQLTSDPRPDH